MSRPTTPARALAAQGLIACALLAGAVATISGPLRADLAEARSRLRALQRQAERAVGVDPSETPQAEREADPDSRAEEIRRRSERAADAGALYDSIMRLAQTHGVRVDRLEPRNQRGKETPDRATPSTTFAVTAAGAYDDIARFLQALESDTGFVTTVSLRMTPAPETEGAGRVLAIFETTHRAFPVGEATADATTDAPSSGADE